MEAPSELVRRAQCKDVEAFATLVPHFERTALALAYSVLGDAASASDVTQEAFLRAWERLDDLKDPERFGPWLARIVRNLATDARRRTMRLAGDLLDEGASDQRRPGANSRFDPAGVIERRETRAKIDSALHELDDLTRSAVVLRYYQDLSSREIGELLELSPAAVDMRLSRARAQLRQTLSWAAPEMRSIPPSPGSPVPTGP
ncbi:MAG: RNA polymerase sigma factor [Tepidisphaeraceae bacterium]